MKEGCAPDLGFRVTGRAVVVRRAGAMIFTVADFAGLGAGAGDRDLAVTIHAAPAAATGPYAAASALTVPGDLR